MPSIREIKKWEISEYDDELETFIFEDGQPPVQDGILQDPEYISAAIFQFLNAAGVPTYFSSWSASNQWRVKRCYIIPISWVARRRINSSTMHMVKPDVTFTPVTIEPYYDNNCYTLTQIIERKFDDVELGHSDVHRICTLTRLTFQLLERVWKTNGRQLFRLKLKFGIDATSQIVLAGMIYDGVWDLSEQLPCQGFGSNCPTLQPTVLFHSLLIQNLTKSRSVESEQPQVGIVISLGVEEKSYQPTISRLNSYGVSYRILSLANTGQKLMEGAMTILEEFNQITSCKCIIVLNGQGKRLASVVSLLTSLPVISCQPSLNQQPNQERELCDDSSAKEESVSEVHQCETDLCAAQAGYAAAQIVAEYDLLVWSKIRAKLALGDA